MKKGWIFGIISSFNIAIYSIYVFVQPTYSYQLLDPRYDAHKYAQAYAYFKGLSSTYQLSFPFNTRILMPWLAAQLPFNDLKTDFIWLNGLFFVLAMGLLVFVWQKLQIRLSLILVASFWVACHWKGLVRMYLPDPVTADVGGYFWLTSFLALLLIGKGYYFSILIRNRVLSILGTLLLAILGTLQKESFIAVTGVTTLWTWWLLRIPNTEKIAPIAVQKDVSLRIKSVILCLALLITILTHYLVSIYFPASAYDWRNNSLVSIFRGIKRYMLQPELLFHIPVSWFLAYGTLWLAVLPVRFSPTTLEHKLPNSHYLLLQSHCCLWLFLSVFGGGDTTRILFTGMPFILTLLLLKLNQKPFWVTCYILLTSLPLMRLNEIEPDLGLYPFETQRWCIECWTLGESWGYGAYAFVVLAGYYYFMRRLGAISSDKTKYIYPRR